jgi:hypothetical protein
MKDVFGVIAYWFSERMKSIILWARGWSRICPGLNGYSRGEQVLPREFAIEKSEKEIREIIRIARS